MWMCQYAWRPFLLYFFLKVQFDKPVNLKRESIRCSSNTKQLILSWSSLLYALSEKVIVFPKKNKITKKNCFGNHSFHQEIQFCNNCYVLDFFLILFAKRLEPIIVHVALSNARTSCTIFFILFRISFCALFYFVCLLVFLFLVISSFSYFFSSSVSFGLILFTWFFDSLLLTQPANRTHLHCIL